MLHLKPEPGARAKPVAPLTSFLTPDDYPAAAIRAGEHGTVSFRLSVGADGRVYGCAVTGSSGSAVLDSATCRLMTSRARFTPAGDKRGRPRADDFEGRIEWKLPAPRWTRIALPERPAAAMNLWSRCAWGETSRLALSALDPVAVAERALAACTALESAAARELEAAAIGEADRPKVLQAFRDDFLVMLRYDLERVRGTLGSPQGK
ncbi:MAG TPA: energy transducer TonB [Allosphingosinicella sp.]